MAEPAVSVLSAALRCRCPRCGKAPLYDGLLTVKERCEACGLDLRQNDTGDGPAVFVMFALSVVVVGLAFWVDFAFAPPLWVHIVVWPLVTLPLALLLMRPLKAALVALQYRTRSSEMGL